MLVWDPKICCTSFTSSTTCSAITPLRPSGMVEVNGEKLNAITRGEYVDSNTKIKIISVEGNKIVVEAVDVSG